MVERTEPDLTPQHYFADTLSGLIRWSDDAGETAWYDGTTIAFRAEIHRALGRLASGPLPSLNELLLALAVMRGSWPDLVSTLARLVHQCEATFRFSTGPHAHHGASAAWMTSCPRLNRLNHLATAQSVTDADRIELLAMVFEGDITSHRRAQQKQLVASFAAGEADRYLFRDVSRLWVGAEDAAQDAAEDAANDAAEQNQVLSGGLQREHEQRLEAVFRLADAAASLAERIPDDPNSTWLRRLRTGIADDVAPAPQVLPDQRSSVQDLLAELTDDPELSGLVSLAQDLAAAISLPRPLDAADTLQSGGVSDISNRGQLDRLLLTELANDDLTLAMRIAMNEAMYIRRESPPRPQPHVRHVLIDTSLPLWGIPRIYALAMALALHVSSDRHTRMACYRSIVPGMEEAFFSHRSEIDAHLMCLSPTEHCGGALPAFAKVVTESGDAADPVIITTADGVDQDSFRRLLDQTPLTAVWLICVSRDGQLQVFHRTRQGRALFKQIHLPVLEILSPRDAETAVDDLQKDHRPAIVQVTPFPLLLSHHVRQDRVWKWNDCVVAVSDDGRLTLWHDRRHGGQQLADGLPTRSESDVFLVSRDGQSLQLAVAGHRRLTLVTIRSDSFSATIRTSSHSLESVKFVVAVGDQILMVGLYGDETHRHVSGRTWCVAIDVRTGHQVGATEIAADSRKIHGRCVRLENRWTLIVWTGSLTHWVFQELPDEFQQCADLCELPGGELIGTTESGSLVVSRHCAHPGVLWLRDYLRRHGHVRLVPQRTVSERVVLSLDVGLQQPAIGEVDLSESRLVGSDVFSPRQSEAKAVMRQISVRTPHYRFRRIGVGTKEQIILSDHSGSCSTIVFDRSQQQLLMKPWKGTTHDLPMQTFRDLADSYLIGRAEWGNGCVAWLDSRGLLHLRSALQSAPDVTLTLRDGRLSGWHSRGAVFGDEYTCGTRLRFHSVALTSDQNAWEIAILPFIQSVPWNYNFSYNTLQVVSTPSQAS